MHPAYYWDASAILSLLVGDEHAPRAREARAVECPHLVSSLAFAEVCAVMARLERENRLSAAGRRRALGSIQARPWSALHLQPDRSRIAELGGRHPLRGADLWHLATAATLAAELPGVGLITFDARLAEAAAGEGLGVAA